MDKTVNPQINKTMTATLNIINNERSKCLGSVNRFLNDCNYMGLFLFLESSYPLIFNDSPLIRLALMELNILNSVLETKHEPNLRWDYIKNSIDEFLVYLSNFVNFNEIAEAFLTAISSEVIIKSQLLQYKIEEMKHIFSNFVDILLDKHKNLIELHLNTKSDFKVGNLKRIKDVTFNETFYCKKILWFPKEVMEFHNQFEKMIQSEESEQKELHSHFLKFKKAKQSAGITVGEFDLFACFLELKNTATQESYSLLQDDKSIKEEAVINEECHKNSIMDEDSDEGINSSDEEERSARINEQKSEKSEKAKEEEIMREDEFDEVSIKDEDKVDEEKEFQLNHNAQITSLEEKEETMKPFRPFKIIRGEMNEQSANNMTKPGNTNPKKMVKELIISKNLYFEFTKRENIDKTVMRKFRKFLILKAKKSKEEYPEFWRNFCIYSYIPPFRLENIEFKSFCTNYMLWVFSHHGGKELYASYIASHLDNLIGLFKNKYPHMQENELTKYLLDLGNVFSIDFMNNGKAPDIGMENNNYKADLSKVSNKEVLVSTQLLSLLSQYTANFKQLREKEMEINPEQG